MRWAFSLLITKLRQAFPLLMKNVHQKRMSIFFAFSGVFFFILTFLLVYNCFTMLCYFLPCSVNQLYITSLLSLPSLPPIPPIQVISELPVPRSSFPLAVYFTHGSVYMSMLLSQFVLPSSSPHPCVHRSTLYIHISNPALQIG